MLLNSSTLSRVLGNRARGSSGDCALPKIYRAIYAFTDGFTFFSQCIIQKLLFSQLRLASVLTGRVFERMTIASFHFQAHVSDCGVIALPPDATNLYGKNVVVNVDIDENSKRNISFEELCDAWCADERSAKEVIRDIYESRTIGRERESLSVKKLPTSTC